MEIVVFVEQENFEKLKDALFKDEIVSRASIKYKSAKDFGKEGYYFIISGNEEQIKKARELCKELGEEVEEKEKILEENKKEEEKAIEGFGNIFQ